jgi:hypothetical protein
LTVNLKTGVPKIFLMTNEYRELPGKLVAVLFDLKAIQNTEHNS